MSGSILPGCSVLPPLPPPDAENGEQGPTIGDASETAGDKANPTADGKAGDKANRHAGDRFASINSFIDVGMAKLLPVQQSVWHVLWRDTKRNGLARTSQTSIAARIGVTDRTVRRAIDRLEKDGFVAVVQRGGVRRGPTIYRVVPVPPPQTVADTGDR